MCLALLRPLLHGLLALLIGIGPTSATALAASLHTPLCACAGCGLSDEASCCAPASEAEREPRLSSEEAACPCGLDAPGEKQPGERCTVCLRERASSRESRALSLEFAGTFVALRASTRRVPPGRSCSTAPAVDRGGGARRAAALRVFLI
jgi:hypothetical protein